eukprot:Em0013g1131a
MHWVYEELPWMVQDLEQDLKSKLIGDLQQLVLALMESKPVYDARCLRNAMKVRGHELEKDVMLETRGHFKSLLVKMCRASRDESGLVDHSTAVRDAVELYEAGEKKWSTDESKFITILGLRNFEQLSATFEEYRKAVISTCQVAQIDIMNTIEHELSGDLKVAFRTVVQCVYSRPTYFAERLHYSLAEKLLRVDDETLIRVVVSRSEIDLAEIKQRFMVLYHKSLYKMIEEKISGNYCKLLLAIVGLN